MTKDALCFRRRGWKQSGVSVTLLLFLLLLLWSSLWTGPHPSVNQTPAEKCSLDNQVLLMRMRWLRHVMQRSLDHDKRPCYHSHHWYAFCGRCYCRFVDAPRSRRKYSKKAVTWTLISGLVIAVFPSQITCFNVAALMWLILTADAESCDTYWRPVWRIGAEGTIRLHWFKWKVTNTHHQLWDTTS